jgi:hypothetical protein
MEIIINHVTRMQKGFCCVAGVETATDRHVRPVLIGRLNTKFLARYGGPFDMACTVDLGLTEYQGSRPETEDHLFEFPRAKRVADIEAELFWKLLKRVSKPTLLDIFGPDLLPRGRHSCGVDLRRGQCSLGCLTVAAAPELFIRCDDGHQRIRLRLREGPWDLDLGVTDIRLYGADHVTPDHAIVNRTAQRLRRVGETILSVGLTRPRAGPNDPRVIHWLQVNNVHLADDPCWRLG